LSKNNGQLNIFSKKTVRRLALVLIALLCITSASIGIVQAKYVYSNRQDAAVYSKEFYFESDVLVEGGKEYFLNPGTTSVNFVLKNCADSLRFSADQISYKLTASDGVLSITNGTLSGEMVSTATFSLSNLEDGKSYTVTAVGKAGYSRTISATFTVKKSQPKLYMHVADNAEYVLLTVWTEDVNGTISVKFPMGLIPDNTQPDLASITEADGVFTDELAKYSSKTYRFFKNSSFTSGEFTVMMGELKATKVLQV